MVGLTTGPGGLFSPTTFWDSLHGFFISLLFTFIIRKITFIIREMGFYYTKWNGEF